MIRVERLALLKVIVLAFIALALQLLPGLANAALVTARSEDLAGGDPFANLCFKSSGGPSESCTSGPTTSASRHRLRLCFHQHDYRGAASAGDRLGHR